MHRAALKVVRSTYLTTTRSLSRVGSRTFFVSNPWLGQSSPRHGPAHPLHSSMHLRNFSIPLALISSLVGFGAWYTYGNSERSLDKKAPAGILSAPAADALPTRKLMYISPDEVITRLMHEEGPISKTTADGGFRILEVVTPQKATSILRTLEQSFLVSRGEGVVRFDLDQLPSNYPIEDDHAEKIMEAPAALADAAGAPKDWMMWGVFDGHGGWLTSAKLRQALIPAVVTELKSLYQKADGAPSPNAIDSAIKTAFVKLDDEIVHRNIEKVLEAKSKPLAAELIPLALTGSCALLSFYDTHSKELRVACTGDSRAVLGRRADSGKWTATMLSEDQTGSTPSEVARIMKEHPQEPNAVHKGRILGGLEPSRAFGDAMYKWSHDLGGRLKRYFTTSRPRYSLTPPYVTAEPIVTTTVIQPEKGDFVVMATDGLWEMLSNEEVIGLVGKWLDSPHGGSGPKSSPSPLSQLMGIFGPADAGLPVQRAANQEQDGQRDPFRREQWGIKKVDFVVRDRNAATHLIRNALGGKNDDAVCALLTLPAPSSRRYRDDLTVQVIFFGLGDSTGEIRVNKEATAPTETLKAKL